MKNREIQKSNDKNGLPIVVTVLISIFIGLLLVTIFVALPVLQRSQRDNQRRNDITRVNVALAQYMANNFNRMPDIFPDSEDRSKVSECDTKDANGFCKAYLLNNDNSFEDPDGTPYTFKLAHVFQSSDIPEDWDTSIPSGNDKDDNEDNYEGNKPMNFDHTIYVSYNAKCSGENVKQASGFRKVALQYKLEGGGVTCVNN